MGFFRNLFFGRPAIHDDGERVPCAQCKLDELPSNPDLQRPASNVRGTAPDRRSAARPDANRPRHSNSASGRRAAPDRSAGVCSPDDVIVACERCGASVAIDRAAYDSARRDNAEILCPACGERAARDHTVALAAAGYRDQPATVYDYGYADEIVPVVLDLPSVVVIDELPIVAVSADFGCPAVVDNVAPTDFGGADTFGGGGADGTWPTD